MYKKLTLLILSLLCIDAIKAQKIYFSDTSNSWHTVVSSCGGDDYIPLGNQVHYTDDTIINGELYHALPFQGGSAFIREDTAAGKVYAFAPGSPGFDTTEQVLYDYTLQYGDTFVSKYTTHIVSGIDSVVINNTMHKVWYLTCIDPPGQSNFVDYKVVEGVGCTNTPLYPLYPYFFEACLFEICFQNNGNSPAFSNAVDTFSWHYDGYNWNGIIYYDNATSCTEDFNLAVRNVIGSSGEAILFPNPITSSSKIMLLAEISSGTLRITNHLGQLIQQREIYRQKEVNIGDVNLPPGLYYYHIYDNTNHVTIKGKFTRI